MVKRDLILFQRFNKADLIRICSNCGHSYLYSHYLRKGLCATCMEAAKKERRQGL